MKCCIVDLQLVYMDLHNLLCPFTIIYPKTQRNAKHCCKEANTNASGLVPKLNLLQARKGDK